MVSAAANIKVSPVGLVLLLIVGVSFLLYFKDIFMNSAGLGQQLQDKSLTVSLKQLLIAAIEATERGGKRVKEIRDSNDVKVSNITNYQANQNQMYFGQYRTGGLYVIPQHRKPNHNCIQL